MYRFAFDLGSGSLGWAVFALDEGGSTPVALTDLGVRVFPSGRDPQSKESNALGRRQPRQQRRQIDRRKRPGFQRRPGGESPPKRTVRPRSLERSGSRMEQSGFKPPTGQSFPSVGFRTDRRADLSTLRKHRP